MGQREDAKALLEQVSWMLIIDWDPIGVATMLRR
jgi:hypothetical protein